MQYLRLGINIDHIATLRNARGGIHPDPILALEIIEKAGASGVTAHLREDRRHIRDEDLLRIKSATKLPLNMEMAATDEMLEIALQVRPNACCLVPEGRHELTTEGGLDVVSLQKQLTPYVAKLHDNGIKVSLFVAANLSQVEAAKNVGADIIELHTGNYCHNEGKLRDKYLQEIIVAAKLATLIGLECHAGHGLCYETTPDIAAIGDIVELNIGHFLIGEAIFTGLHSSVAKMRQIIDGARQ